MIYINLIITRFVKDVWRTTRVHHLLNHDGINAVPVGLKHRAKKSRKISNESPLEEKSIFLWNIFQEPMVGYARNSVMKYIDFDL